jgi:ssDNA-binding Zn-finger/Zn-ribbon topoisomerase 1
MPNHIIDDSPKRPVKPDYIGDPEPCPECGSEMIFRESALGPFWGCSKFPSCRGKAKATYLDLDPDDRTPEEQLDEEFRAMARMFRES